MEDKKLQIINDGRIASLAENHISDLISEMKSKKMRAMTNALRIGEVSHPMLMSYLGAVVALEDMESDMRQKIQRGERAAAELQREK